MKKIYILLVMLVQLFMVENVLAQCTHTISLYDTYGDGWNGGSVTVTVNGTPVLTNITLGGGAGPLGFNFSASNGDNITVTYSAGSWAYENWFSVTDGGGGTLVNNYYPNTSGTWTGTGSCSTPPPPTAIIPPVCYDMNGNTGGFNNGVGGAAWNSGATTTPSSGTGPQGADANGGSGFFFTEASGGLTNTTYAMTGYFDLSAGGYNLSFDYHMFGTNMGSLSVLVNGASVWTTSGSSGNVWLTEIIDLSAYTGSSVEITLTSTTGNGWSSDCAIDNVCVNDTPPVISGCTDPNSLNYNSAATIDDGSCYFGIPSSGSNAYNTCGITLYDNGGSVADYSNGSNGQTTLTPSTPGQAIALNFLSFNLENGFDYLYVYDGNSTAAPQVAGSPFSGTTLPANIISSAAGGELTLVFTSDGSVTRPGFEISVSCVTSLPADPTSASASSSSICEGSSTTLSAAGVVGTAYWFEGSCGTTGQIGTGATLTVSPTSTTTYYVRNNDGQWSANCASVTVTVNPIPTVNAGVDQTICAGFPAQLTGTASATTSAPGSITTTFAAGNSQNGNMFDVLPSQSLTITDFDVHFSGTGDFEVYYKTGSHVGFETNAAAWTLAGSANAIAGSGVGVGTPLNLNLALPLTAGQTYAFYVTCSSGGIVNYTNGAAVGNILVSNADITVYEGVGKVYPFGATYSPRNFNGIIHYDVGSSATPSLAWTPAATLSDATILNPEALPAATTTYTLTATANGCSNSDDVLVTVDQPSIPATSIGGTGSLCLGTTTTLTVQGGALNGTSNWEWFSNNCGGTPIGTGASISVTPSTTTTYFVAASANGTCPATACANGTVSLPVPSNNLSGNGETATCTVNQGGYIHLLTPAGDLVASINSNGQNLGTVTATSYLETTPLLIDNCNNIGNPNFQVSVNNRHWVITSAIAPSAPVEVLLPTTEAEWQLMGTEAFANGNINDDITNGLADVGCTKYSGPNENANFPDNCGQGGAFTWHSQTSNGNINAMAGLTGHAATDKYITVDVNSFSEFWLHGSSTSSPLPVELVDFSSRCIDGDVAIEWSTASENNSMHFEVESSVDAFNWEAIAVVDAAQFSTSLIDYAILHEGAAREKNYYRLKQVDTDGAYEYYSIIYSDCGSDFDGAPIIFPNPSKNNFTIDFGGSGMKGIVQLTLVSMEGKEISNRQLNLGEGVSTFQINNLELQPGLYLIKMIDMTGKLFIIKHRFN